MSQINAMLSLSFLKRKTGSTWISFTYRSYEGIKVSINSQSNVDFFDFSFFDSMMLKYFVAEHKYI